MKFNDEITLIVKRLSYREYRPDLLIVRYFIRTEGDAVAYRIFKHDQEIQYCKLSDIVLVNGKEINT